MSFDGKERRGVDKDWLERDRMITEIHTNVKNMKESIDKQTTSFDMHVINDSVEFKSIKKRIFYLTCAIIVIGALIGGPSLAMSFIK